MRTSQSSPLSAVHRSSVQVHGAGLGLLGSALLFTTPVMASETKHGVTVTRCAWDFDSENYCEDEKIKTYARVMETAEPNFNGNLILHFYESTSGSGWTAPPAQRLVVIDKEKKTASPNHYFFRKTSNDYGELPPSDIGVLEFTFSTDSNRLCVKGDIEAYRLSESYQGTPFCWQWQCTQECGFEKTEYVEPTQVANQTHKEPAAHAANGLAGLKIGQDTSTVPGWQQKQWARSGELHGHRGLVTAQDCQGKIDMIAFMMVFADAHPPDIPPNMEHALHTPHDAVRANSVFKSIRQRMFDNGWTESPGEDIPDLAGGTVLQKGPHKRVIALTSGPKATAITVVAADDNDASPCSTRGREKADAAKLQMKQINAGLTMYALKNKGRYPTTSDGLDAARKYFAGNTVPKDPWGNQYIYASPGTHSDAKYELICLGADGKEGGEGFAADIKSWELE